ncbi:MAG: MaoC/PaaZ C-terminal domain-containing protein [Dehalococcoidia bacterium]
MDVRYPGLTRKSLHQVIRAQEIHPMKLLYFEDYQVGQIISAPGSYLVEKEELIEFASKWDPQPFHIDEEAASNSIYGGLTAPAIYTTAVSGWLGNSIEPKGAFMAGLGWYSIEFPNPVRPGDRLSLSSVVKEVRESGTRNDRGIVRFANVIKNQKGEAVLQSEIATLVARRPI